MGGVTSEKGRANYYAEEQGYFGDVGVTTKKGRALLCRGRVKADVSGTQA